MSKKALREVESANGGVMEAMSSCELPRNRKQVYNLKHIEQLKKESDCIPSGVSLEMGPLACVMQMCKDTINTDEAFIRAVDLASEPMIVLATNQQLVDLERFCCNQDHASILSVDPTFNLGPYYVTPSTYQNLMIENEQGSHPIHLGPILIHHTKTLRPFHYFGSTLVSCKPSLLSLRSFGTDGEPELAKAFRLCFPNAVHLRCTNHFRQNVKDKLRSIGVVRSVWKDFLSDILALKLVPTIKRV
jgi:hypothetical protein